MMNEFLKVLMVEDSKADTILIKKSLRSITQANYQIESVENLSTALHILQEEKFDVVLLDLSLPDTSEFNGLLSIQNMFPTLPLIILTSYGDERLALDAVEYGAQDYLFKNTTDAYAMRRSIEYAIKRKQFEGILINQANSDHLTGLANRSMLENQLNMALARISRLGTGIAIFFLDLNHFKQVNDTLGHAIGDRLLQEVALRLKQSIRLYDTAARFGGDEFALLINDIKYSADCKVIAKRIIQQISKKFILANSLISVGVSIGIALCFPKEVTTGADLIRKADSAMYRAKLDFGSSYKFYNGLH